jgi:hypothetical protein
MEYNTHNNYGRPFKVIINSNNLISVFNNNFDNTADHIFTKTVNKVFIGKSPVTKMTKFSGGAGKDFEGNSFLFELNNNTYQHVGRNIFTFDSYNKIVKYVSPIGNNDVPYPYAIDSDGNIYLLIEDVVLINTDLFKKLYTDKYDDPYDYYYSYNLITTDLGFLQPRIPPIKDIEDFSEYNKIKEYYHNDEKYTLRYNPTPENRFGNEDYVYLVLENGEKKYLTRQDFVSLHENFGNLIGFRRILNKELQY